MRQQSIRKLIRGSAVSCLISLVGVFVSALPLMALNPPGPCGPGTFGAGSAINISLNGPTSPVDIGQQVTLTATASDYDYCSSNGTTPQDTVDRFTWYVDGAVYSAGNNLSQISLSFGTGGSHTVKVVADDHPYYADDSAVDAQVTVSVNDPALTNEYTYDKNGNRATMTDSRGVTHYEYDVLNRLTKVIGPDGKWIAYEYDNNGNRTKMTTHSDGTPSFNHVTQYVYNDRGLLSKVYDRLAERDSNGNPTANAVYTGYTYKDNGLVDTITYPNGTEAIHTYNSWNLLTTISNQKSDNTIIAQFDYTYDPAYWGKNGTRTRVVENILKPDGNRINAQVDYEYDDLYRLTHEHRIAYNGGDPGVAYEYNFAYDAAGNRTQWQVVGGSTTNYTYDAANKMTGSDYDEKGNMTHDGISGADYTWDYLNRLTRSVKGQIDESYVYNADGIRVRITPSGGTATNFILSGPEIAEEIAGTNVTSYIGPGLICAIRNTTRTPYHVDGLASVCATTATDQTVESARVYDAYGNIVTSYPDPAGGRFTYAGQYAYQTDETAIHYLFTRYYDASTARFLSRDWIGYKAGTNLYAYVGGNPVNYVDPNGTLTLPGGLPNIGIEPPHIDPIRIPNPLNPAPPVGPSACCIYRKDCNKGDRIACLAAEVCERVGDGPWANCVRAQLRDEWCQVRGNWRREVGWIIRHGYYYGTCTVRDLPWIDITPPKIIITWPNPIQVL